MVRMAGTCSEAEARNPLVGMEMHPTNSQEVWVLWSGCLHIEPVGVVAVTGGKTDVVW